MKMLTAQDLPGAQAPVGFFDPLGFATGGSDVSFFVFFLSWFLFFDVDWLVYYPFPDGKCE